jgi:hypothetical protein
MAATLRHTRRVRTHRLQSAACRSIAVFFYDAPEWACRSANLAVTRPGNRVVFVCGARFQKEMSRNSRNAEAIVIHELLHSLGLGENPPSSDHITARVRAQCGQGGAVAQAAKSGK